MVPMSLTVRLGTTVTWKLDDCTQHTVVADDGSFDGHGQTVTHTFDTAGTVQCHCATHTFMTATIIVK